MFLKLLLAFSLYLNVINTLPIGDHPAKPEIPFTKTSTGQYYIEKILLAQLQDTFDFCGSLGLNALSIESENENKDLSAVLSKLPVLPFWTSGVSTENGWLWEGTNKPVKYFNWAHGQPDIKNTKYLASGIAIYYSDKAKKVVWSDQHLEEYGYIICELNK